MDESGHVPRDRGRPGRELGRRMVESGVEAIEEYLAKHLAFLAYLDEAAPRSGLMSKGRPAPPLAVLAELAATRLR